MWSPWYIAAFITGIVCVLIGAVSYLFSNRKTTLLFRFSFDALAIINGIFVYQATHVMAIWAVVATDGISLIRDVIFMCRDKYKWADNILWVILFEVIFGCSLIFTWAGPIAILPVVGSLINNVALYLKKAKVSKIMLLCGQSFFITYYSILIPSSDSLTLISMLASLTFFISALVGLIVILVKEHNCKRKAS